MLQIHLCKSAAAVNAYYAAGDYYRDGAELPGRWGGKLAALLGLSGEVRRPDFEALADNRDPRSGAPLTLRRDDDRRPAYDFTFSAPKSISLLYEWNRDPRLLDAFNSAVDDVLSEIQDDAAARVRKRGADHDRKVGNLAWAAFNHFESRPAREDGLPDPQMHRHVVIFNAVRDPVENCFKAAQLGDVKADGALWEARFHARLARRVTEMGYDVETRYVRDKRGRVRFAGWDVAGIGRALVEKFSRRTREVEDAAEKLGIEDPKAKAKLGATTRLRKRARLDRDELRAVWLGRLAPEERETLAAVVAKADGAPPRAASDDLEAARHSLAHNFERESVAPLKRLEIDALRRGLGDATPEGVARAFRDLGVIVRERGGERLATVAEALEEERFLAGFAAAGRSAVKPIGVPPAFEGGELGEDQRNAILGLLRSSDRVNLIEGPAGSGKSAMLKAYDRAAAAAGVPVIYLASTSSAVEVLRRDGFEAETVAAFLANERRREAARAARAVVDEASMLGNKDAKRLFQIAKDLDLKLNLIGDEAQHGAVPRGALLNVLKSRGGLTPFRLSEIRRQRDRPYREAVELLAQGKAAKGFDALDRLDWIREVPDDDARYAAIADDYARALDDGKTVLVVCATHAESERAAAAVREALRRTGRLGGDERTFSRLVPADVTEAERGLTSTYRSGDVLQYHQNSKRFKKGTRVVVDDPSRAPIEDASRFQLYRAEPIAIAPGDLLRFTAGVKTLDGKHRLVNGSTQTVAGFTPAGDVRLTNGWVVAADVGHFRLGTVETSFGAQGRTVDRVLVAMATPSLPAINREATYVAASRARDFLRFYVDDKDAVRRAVERSSAKPTALDLTEGPAHRDAPTTRETTRERLRRQLTRLRSWASLSRYRAARDVAPTPTPALRRGIER